MPPRDGGAVTAATPLLEVQELTKHFLVLGGALGWHTRLVRAVDAVSFTLEAGRTMGLVGESGCGKTTTSKLILGLEPPTAGPSASRARTSPASAGKGRDAIGVPCRRCSRIRTPRSTPACAWERSSRSRS